MSKHIYSAGSLRAALRAGSLAARVSPNRGPVHLEVLPENALRVISTHEDAYAYDVHDHLTASTDRTGQVTAYQYDALDRLVLVTYDEFGGVWDHVAPPQRRPDGPGHAHSGHRRLAVGQEGHGGPHPIRHRVHPAPDHAPL